MNALLALLLLFITASFRQASCKEETDDEVKAGILKAINAKRIMHQAQPLTVDKDLETAAIEHAKQLIKGKKLAYSKNEKDQSEMAVATCKKTGESLTGREIIDKWYSEANLFSDSSIALDKKAVDAKRFMQLVWKSSTSVGVAVQSFKAGKKTCFFVVTFITPKAKSLIADVDVKNNVLAAKQPNKEEPEKKNTEEKQEGKQTAEEPQVKKTEEEPEKKESKPEPEKAASTDEETTQGSGVDYTIDYGNDDEDDDVSYYDDDTPADWD